ncbi:MAG: hypothetical protein AB9919_15005 [Geobacteraceae bacterium]
MVESEYKINTIRSKLTTGVTAPYACTIHAVLKYDGKESPYNVYNEQVALRLAQTLHIPVADGVLAATAEGPAYASIKVSPIDLPDMSESDRVRKKVANLYPDESAALVVFDILIGNDDRASNIKVTQLTRHIRMFRAFDHSHALLNIEGDPCECIKRLKSSDIIVQFHPFFEKLSNAALERWVARIVATEDDYIRECCVFGKTFREVTVEMQQSLADALVWRKTNLAAIISSEINRIAPLP